MSNPKGGSKTLHKLKPPYPGPSWPSITSQVEDSILDRLLPLLAPIGQHREKVGAQSKSRNRRKDKNKTHKLLDEQSEHLDKPHPSAVENEDPDLQQYVTIGFNSTVRQLEHLSSKFRSRTNEQQGDSDDPIAPFAVFVCTSMLPPIMTAPLPILARTATIASQVADGIRLVPISQSGAARIAKALKQPRANVVGILKGARHSQELEEFVRDKVEPVDVPWLRDSAAHLYQPVRFHSEDIIVSKAKGVKRKRDRVEEVINK